MRKKQIKFIAEVSIFAALGLILDLIAGMISVPLWQNGGSITIAFVPTIIMGYKYGLKGGLLTGLLIGVIQLLWSSYLITVPQVLLDYVLPNLVIGFVGDFKTQVKKSTGFKQILFITIPIILVCSLRLICLVLSGVLYWEAGIIYSVLYNGTYTLASAIASIIVVILLLKFLPKNYMSE